MAPISSSLNDEGLVNDGGLIAADYFSGLADELSGRVLGYFGTRLKWFQAFTQEARMDTPAGAGSMSGVETVENMRRILINGGTVEPAREVRLVGTFFPSLLMYKGWWERRASVVEQIPWRDGLQRWLFKGFELWGPSWNLNSPMHGDLLGQLAGVDEADSLPLLVPEAKAQDIRQQMLKSWQPFRVLVNGRLCHRSQTGFPAGLEESDRDFQYCVVLQADNPAHSIVPDKEEVELYSGYLWQCWGLKDKVAENRNPSIQDVYFLWEHTDFTKADAVDYNLDSLAHKVRYLEERVGKVVLLQKSSSIVPGETLYPREKFKEFLAVRG